MNFETYLKLRAKAFDLVASTSQGVVRFHSPIPKQPYWTHLMNVHNYLIAKGIKDYDVLIGAILHDVVEDSEITISNLRKNFSVKISKIVELVTKVNNISDDAFYRKILDSNNVGVMQIKIADRIDNALTNYSYSIDKNSVAQKVVETKKYFTKMAKIIGWDNDLKNILDYLEFNKETI